MTPRLLGFFYKELFPDKNFVMIQKDEYELMVESTNLELKSEIMKKT